MLPASRYNFFGHCKGRINKVEILPSGFILVYGIHVYQFYLYSINQSYNLTARVSGNKILPESPEIKKNEMYSYTKLCCCQN